MKIIVVYDFFYIDCVEKLGFNIFEMLGVYVVGDWVGYDEILVDVVVVSGKCVVLYILK